jgi:chitosanase
MFRFFRKSVPSGQGRSERRRSRLAVEALEQRLAPAGFVKAGDFQVSGAKPQLVAAGSFNTNQDATQDLIISNSNNTYSVLLGDGKGKFTTLPAVGLPGAGPAEGVVSGDFNQDGKLDAVIASYGGAVTVLLGNGDGTFRRGAALALPAGAGPTYLTAGDLDLDGKLDLVVSDFNKNQVLVYKGQGDGAFVFHDYNFAQNGVVNPEQAVIADLNGDKIPDVAVASKGSGSVSIFKGLGGGFITAAGFIALRTDNGATEGKVGSIGLAAGDLDGDNKPDLAVANFGTGAQGARTLSILRNVSTGGNFAFAPQPNITLGDHLLNVVIADFDGDGRRDLAVTSAGNTEDDSTTEQQVLLFHNRGQAAGEFRLVLQTTALITGKNPVGLIAADLDGNGTADLVSANQAGNNASVFLQVPLDVDQKLRADRLISVFENSTTRIQYSYIENLDDGRGYTAGRAGFTTATGDFLDVVQRYLKVQPTSPLKRYLPPLRQLARTESDSTKGLEGLVQTWKQAARDQRLQAVQDEVVDDTYYQPAVRRWRDLGLQSALSLAAIYDTIIQHGEGNDPDGLPKLLQRSTRRAGGSPQTGVAESVWLRAFLQERKRTLANPANKATKEAWGGSGDRVKVFQQLAAQNNYDFRGPFTVTVYGDRFTIP